MVRQRLVVISARAAGVGMNDHLRDATYSMEEAMAYLFRDGVRLRQRQFGVDLDVHGDVHGMSYPARAHICDLLHAWHRAGCRDNRRDDAWIDGIQQALQDAAGGR